MPGIAGRLQKLRRALEAQNLDALIVTQPENRRYLSGFTGSAGTLFITQGGAILITDFRYLEQSAKEAPQFEVVEALPDVLARELSDLATETGARRVGFESHHVTFAEYGDWTAAAADYQLVPIKELVEEMRALKDEDELAKIREAVSLGDAALAHLRELIAPGMTEKEAAWELETYMRTHGAQGVAFDVIVAGGPNGAMPHAETSDDDLQIGQPIVIDLGARLDGYHSDLTRTLCLGEPDDQFQEIYDLVLKAQLAAEEGIRPGMPARQADALARDIITGAGYGEYFGHGLGHGVGLAVQEKPKAGKLSWDILYPGMTLTVEPGIYIPDWGGVRIEDLTVITEEGVEVVSQADKDPLVKLS
jgi:Xaa-Pro aminopeptidase